jgi:hypothetical protein
MEKINRQRFRVILFLSVITVLLLGGIVINQSIKNYISANNHNSISQSVFLPSLSSQRCYGTNEDDSFINAFSIGDDTFIFYNSQCGIIKKESKSDPFEVELEGKLLCVTLTSCGFAVVIEKNGNLSIKIVGFDGIPTSSISINLKNAQIQYLDYDGSVCVAIKHQGDFDYVLSYYKYDIELNEIYRRDIYSLYNLSTVACYPMSNKTIIFFNAQYGSVKRGGYSIIHNSSLAMETEYFSNLENYEVCSAKPFNDGFIVTAISNSITYAITLDGNMQESLTKLTDNCVDAHVYTNSTDCYIGLVRANSVELFNFNTKTSVPNFAQRVYDCIFIDNAPIFAVCQNNVTNIIHLNTGINSPILNVAPLSLKLKKHSKLAIFASFDSTLSPFLKKGGVDVFYATLL